MSPILIRPVREQLEHDRLIRFLQQKFEKKFDVVVNVGDSQAGPVKLGGPAPFFPDLVLLTDGKIAGLIEVETGESTNNLEALAQWQHFGRARVPFSLYVPVLMVDAARRFCQTYKVSLTEMWTYRGLYEGFDLVRVLHDPHAVANTPKSTTVAPKLLPPVTPVHVEPEKEAKILELTNLVELANRTFRAAQGRTGTAAAARAAAKAAAKAAAAKPVPMAPKAAEVGPPVKGGKGAAPVAAAKPAAAPPPSVKAGKPAKVAAPKPAAKPAPKPVKTAAKAAKSAQVAKPVAGRPAKAAKVAKVAKVAKKPAGKAVARSPKAKVQKSSKPPAMKKAQKGTKAAKVTKAPKPKAPAASTKAKKTGRKR